MRQRVGLWAPTPASQKTLALHELHVHVTACLALYSVHVRCRSAVGAACRRSACRRSAEQTQERICAGLGSAGSRL